MRTGSEANAGACRGNSRGRCRGIMLLDCLIYISLLALILGLAFEAFFRVLGHSTQLERNVGDIVRALQAGERWREDVRAATGPLSLGPEAEALTLRIPRGTGQITYAFRQGALSREETPGGGPVEVLRNVAGSVFHRDQRRHVAAWRWELELQGKQKVSRVRPLFTFQAVARSETKP